MSWGKLVKVGGADTKDMPQTLEFGSLNEDIAFFGRMQVDKKELAKKSFTHETQIVIPANYISATQFSIRRTVTEDKVSFYITNIGRNPAIIDGVAIPSSTPFEIKSGSVWAIRYKKAIRLEYRFEPIDVTEQQKESEDISKDETQEVGQGSATKEKPTTGTSQAESITSTAVTANLSALSPAKLVATDAMNVEESQSFPGPDSVLMQQLASVAEEKRNLEERNMKMIATVEELQSEVFDATNKITDLNRQVNEKGQEIVSLKEGMRESEFAKVAVDARNVELQSQLDAMKSNKTVASTKSTLLEEEVAIMKQTVENRDIMIAKLNKAYSNEQKLRSDAQKLNKEISEQAKESIASLKAFNAGMQSLLDKEHSQYTVGLQTIRTHLEAVLEKLVLPSSASIFPQQESGDMNTNISTDIPYLQSFVSQMVPLVTSTVREQQGVAVQAASRVIEDVQKGPLVDLEASIKQLMEQLSRNEQNTQDYADQSQTSISAVESFAAQAATLATDAATTETVHEENQFMDMMDCTQMNVEEEEEEEEEVDAGADATPIIITGTTSTTDADRESSEVAEVQVGQVESEGQDDMSEVPVVDESVSAAVVGEQAEAMEAMEAKEGEEVGQDNVVDAMAEATSASATEEVSASPAIAPLATSVKESVQENGTAMTEETNAQKENVSISANNSAPESESQFQSQSSSKGKRKSSNDSQSQSHDVQSLVDNIPEATEEGDTSVTMKKMKTDSQNLQLSTKSQQEVVALD